MSVKVLSFLPHPPLSISAIGGDKFSELTNTINSYKKIKELLYLKKIDTVILLSSHGNTIPSSFCINHSPDLKIDLSSFGDLTEYSLLKNDIGFAYQIREFLETTQSITLYNDENLDYASSVVAYHLLRDLKNIKIIPISASDLNYERHWQFGRQLKDITITHPNNIAIISTGDMSHCLLENSPGGYHEDGKKFDTLILESLKDKNLNKIINLSPELVANAKTCGYRSLLILLGIIQNMNFKTEIMSYEHPFGIGYLSVNFSLE